MTIQEFSSHYWNKEELKKICLNYNVSSHGIKAELEHRIKGFLAGEDIADDRKQHTNLRKSAIPKEITLDTKLIPEGFKFNRQAREFFKDIIMFPNFHSQTYGSSFKGC
ncbi:SAP domain-containing protein [Virgibacillus ndiopensis]|uniref:SAP domain-containing protein n=1 Tax=Virgibacillus ndiopensis TaxID=2004408 RepID=UPI000C0861C5|nr:SAP domain-containing protein [Virgibacillus ndiopensis]